MKKRGRYYKRGPKKGGSAKGVVLKKTITWIVEILTGVRRKDRGLMNLPKKELSLSKCQTIKRGESFPNRY